MNNAGHVRLHRRVREHPIWTQLSPAVFKVFSYCVMEAAWKPESRYDGSAETAVPRGSFVTSFRKIASDCNLSVKQVRIALDHLERLQVARRMTIKAHDRAHEASLVTVLNYESYQSQMECDGHTKGQAEGTRWAREGHTNDSEVTKNWLNPNGINNPTAPNRPPLKEEEGNKGRSKEETPSGRFEDWWILWSSIRGTNHRFNAEQVYIRQVTTSTERDCFDCTLSYLESLADTRRGYNPENFLIDQSRDGFKARWPKSKRTTQQEEWAS